jgi:hypothetical protein
MTAEPEVIVSSEEHIMAYMRVHGSRPDGRTYDNHQAYLYRFTDGLLSEGQSIPVTRKPSTSSLPIDLHARYMPMCAVWLFRGDRGKLGANPSLTHSNLRDSLSPLDMCRHVTTAEGQLVRRPPAEPISYR